MNYFQKDTSCSFYIDQHPNKLLDPYIESGDISQKLSLSEDGLTKTLITRYKNLEVFNQAINLNTLEVRNAVVEFNRSIKISKKSLYEIYKVVGFSSPFRLTSIYTFKPDCPYQPIFFNMLSYEQSKKNLLNFELLQTVQTVTIVESFKDDTEFNTIRFDDMYWLVQLHAVGAKRHLHYELI